MIRITAAVALLPFLAFGEYVGNVYVGNVTGVVRDASTRQPLANATVVLVRADPNGGLKAGTDSQGRFLINNVPVEYPYTMYSVVASHAGHKTEVLPDVRVLPGAVMALECSISLRSTGAGGLHSSLHVAMSFIYSHERYIDSPGRAQSGKIFATREGLVGRTTANGHVIRSSDRFVALPSRRVLNNRGERTFLVTVTYGGRSATVPVWDIGPWNIKDDYWSSSSERETWRSLSRGLPQAQAAYLDGHNGGRDGFGRQVMNPAGIDLSDAVFWHDLQMRDNDWVAVEYLWDRSLISTREPTPTARRRPDPPTNTRRKQPRRLHEIIALAEAILMRSRW